MKWLLGAPVAERALEECSSLHKQFISKAKRRACLAVIRAGEDPASIIYIQKKREAAEKIGYTFHEYTFPSTVEHHELHKTIFRLNHDPHVDGILVQLPLPNQICSASLLEAVAPEKDVDGLNSTNFGKIPQGLAPCTPLGCLELIDYYGLDVCGKNAVVVGASRLVGLPLALLLLSREATVFITHKKTQNLENITRQADFLFVCAGVKGLITSHHITEGSCIIDIGIHRTPQGIVGDVCPSAYEKASAATPVPGGVGPLTVSSLMRNLLKAAFSTAGI